MTARARLLRGRIDFSSGLSVRDPESGMSSEGSSGKQLLEALEEALRLERDYYDWFEAYSRRARRCIERASKKLDSLKMQWSSPNYIARRNAYSSEHRQRLSARHKADVSRRQKSLQAAKQRMEDSSVREQTRRGMLAEETEAKLQELDRLLKREERNRHGDSRPSTAAAVEAAKAKQLRGSEAITALPLSREVLIAVGPPAETDRDA